MSTGKKIEALCARDGIKISKLESELNFSRGSLTKNDPNAMRADRVRDIAKYFGVTPTYIMTDMVYCVCPTCGAAFNPLDATELSMHEELHGKYIRMRDKIGYLLTPTQAATKRAIAEDSLKDINVPAEGKVFHYETLVQCDFAEHAYFNNFESDISFFDFMRDSIRNKKYFDLIPESIIKILAGKYNVDLNDMSETVTDMYKKDETFMAYISDLWDLPSQLRYDVYKAIRHAKRDYADKEYYTNPYANISNHCHDRYDPNSEKCQNCRSE